MTLEELKKGEHVTVEYKLDIPQEREKYLKSAVAFANGAGGKLVFGVKNQTWDVIGFPDDERSRNTMLLQTASMMPARHPLCQLWKSKRLTEKRSLSPTFFPAWISHIICGQTA